MEAKSRTDIGSLHHNVQHMLVARFKRINLKKKKAHLRISLLRPPLDPASRSPSALRGCNPPTSAPSISPVLHHRHTRQSQQWKAAEKKRSTVREKKTPSHNSSPSTHTHTRLRDVYCPSTQPITQVPRDERGCKVRWWWWWWWRLVAALNSRTASRRCPDPS